MGTTKIKIKLPRRQVLVQSQVKSPEQVMLEKFRHIEDITDEEKELLRDYAQLNKVKRSFGIISSYSLRCVSTKDDCEMCCSSEIDREVC